MKGSFVYLSVMKANVEELQTFWLADQLHNMVQGEPMAGEALKSVAKSK